MIWRLAAQWENGREWPLMCLVRELLGRNWRGYLLLSARVGDEKDEHGSVGFDLTTWLLSCQ